jgi:hypothetical protein
MSKVVLTPINRIGMLEIYYSQFVWKEEEDFAGTTRRRSLQAIY